MPYTPKNNKIFCRAPKNQDEFTFSYSEKVFNACTSVKEGTAKLIQKVCYWYSVNKRKGIEGVLISPHVLARQMKRSVDSLSRYLKEAVRTGLILWEKVRDDLCKVRYHLTPTKKLLNLLRSLNEKPQSADDLPQSADDLPQSAETKNLCETQKTADDKPVSDTLCIKNVILNKINNSNPFQSAIEECKQPTAPSSPTSSSTNTSLRGEDAIEPSLAVRIEAAEASQETQSVVAEVLQYVEGLSEGLRQPFTSHDLQKVPALLSGLQESHLGASREGIEIFGRYCKDIAAHGYLNGHRRMPSGGYFRLNIHFLFSEGLFSSWMDKTEYFHSYKSSKGKEQPLAKESEGAKVSVDPSFDALVKLNESTRDWVRESSLEWDGDTLIVKSPRRFASDHLKGNYEALFKEAYQTDKVCFMVAVEGENK